MSKETTQAEQNTKPQQLELLDCGQASKTTKGVPLLILREMSPPPFDKLLMF